MCGLMVLCKVKTLDKEYAQVTGHAEGRLISDVSALFTCILVVRPC